MRRLALGLVLAVGLLAQGTQVYVTARGQKYYHSHRDCISLTRSSTVLVADEKEAQSHGLTLCPICAHRRHSKTVGGENKNWAKPEVTK